MQNKSSVYITISSFFTVYVVIINANGVMETQLEYDSSSVDAIKNTMIDISNGDTGVIKGYNDIGAYDNQTPKGFFEQLVGFDVRVEPPTEKTDWWAIGVFGSRRAIDLLYVASHKYDSQSYNAILDKSRHTDRMFYGHEENLEIEAGFLQLLTEQSRQGRKYGFAHKTTVMPHSMEMMDRVYNGIVDILRYAMIEANYLIGRRIVNGTISISDGGLSLE